MLNNYQPVANSMADPANQAEVQQLIDLCDLNPPLSSSDIAAIQQLLAADASVANGKGKSK